MHGARTEVTRLTVGRGHGVVVALASWATSSVSGTARILSRRPGICSGILLRGIAYTVCELAWIHYLGLEREKKAKSCNRLYWIYGCGAKSPVPGYNARIDKWVKGNIS